LIPAGASPPPAAHRDKPRTTCSRPEPPDQDKLSSRRSSPTIAPDRDATPAPETLPEPDAHTTNATVRRSTFVFPIHDVQDPTGPAPAHHAPAARSPRARPRPARGVPLLSR
jgi:hypothetical protein